MAYLHFARNVLASMFRHPATTEYPLAPRQYQNITRGKVEINIDDCIFCGMCMRTCPADAIRVDRAGKTWEINPFSCVQCGGCVEHCPKKCLKMDTNYTKPSEKKTEMVFHADTPQT
jgi:formate hydrogenlyase subunit 6/NADH:ubiquinone oxidoreductase subunit I